MAKRHQWTEAELAWLREHIHEHGWRTIHVPFNQHFGLNLTQSSVEHACLRNGINHDRKGEHGFVAGERNDYSVRASIGTERIDARGRVFIKITDHPARAKLGKDSNWVQKDRYLWEKAYGKLGTDQLLIHLDNDKQNCELSNLYVVSRATNRRMAAWGWFFSNPAMTLTAVKCCELLEAAD